MEAINYPLIALAAVVAIASPGPATLAIAGTSMRQGRKAGLLLALGVLTGSLCWSTAAAFGLGAVMYANLWLFELIKISGAVYLIYLSFCALRSALTNTEAVLTDTGSSTLRTFYKRGLLLHLTNPKAILFFTALYSLAVPGGSSTGVLNLSGLLSVILFVGTISAGIFLGYAVLFSSAPVSRYYLRSRRYFEAAFAMIFGIAGCKLLVSRVEL